MRFSLQPTLATLVVLAILSFSTDAHPLPDTDNNLNQLQLLARATRSSYFRKRQALLSPLSPLSPLTPPAHNVAPVAAPASAEPAVVPPAGETAQPKISPPPSAPVPSRNPAPSTKPDTPSHSPAKPTNPSPEPQPNTSPPSTNPPPSPPPNPNPSPSKTTHSSSGSHSAVASPSASLGSNTTDVASPSGQPSPDDGSGVPTKVSDKVFIGLGIVGGLIVFALGGVAFCRHRRKKNLATALLQQTAQFNHNNPYAKISEASKTPKESLPMTPTKPLGTFSVRSTYTPALADEIEINLGDSVTILQEYDDGWCMGVNNTRGGIKGVFPRHCLEGHYDNSSQYGGGGGDELGYYPPNPGFQNTINKRMSSIPPQGWHSQGQVNGYNPGSAYGDYSTPQYGMPPPNQGYYQGGY